MSDHTIVIIWVMKNFWYYMLLYKLLLFLNSYLHSLILYINLYLSCVYIYIYTYVHICTCTMHIMYNYWSHFYLFRFLKFLICCWNRDFSVLFSDEVLKWCALQILSSSITTFVHMERLMIVSLGISRCCTNQLLPSNVGDKTLFHRRLLFHL